MWKLAFAWATTSREGWKVDQLPGVVLKHANNCENVCWNAGCRPIPGIQLYEIGCMHLDSMYPMSIFPDSYLSALWPQFWEAFCHAGRVHAMWLDWQMSRELLKQASKKRVDFPRIFSLFNLEEKLWGLFSASPMKSVFCIKGSLLRS